MKKFLLTVILLFLFTTFSGAQNLWEKHEYLSLPAQHYVVYQTNEKIKIDGVPDESAWENAAWTLDFMDIEGSKKPAPEFRTRIKMLWDNSCLYILAELEEPHIWAYFDEHDQIIYHENDFEIFLDPNNNAHDYFEFELNAANTLFDLFMTKPYRDGGIPLITWNAPGFTSAVSISGTLNNPADTDKKWTIEMAIPFESLKLGLKSLVPADGQTWKVNFSRVQWKTDVVDGKYQKRKDKNTGLYLSENNWVWSPTGEINLHVPERWGMLQFSESDVKTPNDTFEMPQYEELKKQLWLVYYKQRDFMLAFDNYATSLVLLSLPESVSDASGNTAKLEMQATELQFTALLKTSDGKVFTINEEGFLSEKIKTVKP
jgi:hypothetical protein